MAEVIEATVREANNKIITEHGFKLAAEPKVVLPSEEGAVEGVIAGKSDLAYTVELEIVPPITLGDFKTIKLERLTAAVTDAEIDQAAQSIAEQNRPFTAKAEGAVKGDRATISFRGTIDGQPFDGGSLEDVPIVLGSQRFLPGFEDNLIGLKTGESRAFNLKFPDDYASSTVAGKEATFTVDVRSVEAPGAVTVDDEFAKSLGFDSLAKLRDALRERLQRDHAAASRQKLKRALLDQLDERHKFEPPPSLVEEEFNHVWTAVESDLKQQARTFADEGTTEEKARAEYRAIAERRVRLGLVIAEIGERNNISVSEEQLQAGVMEQVRQMPGREREVWDYYRNNPGALAALRAPLFEDKVVDFLLELAEVTDKQVSREELFSDDAA
jgi:trigger factor